MASSYTTRLGDSPEEGIKAPVVATATTNITLSGEQTVAGVAVTAGQRVCVTGQTDASENGLYNCAVGAWTRTKDFNAANDVVNGVLVLDSGTSAIRRAQFTGTWTPDTTEVVFTLLSNLSEPVQSVDNVAALALVDTGALVAGDVLYVMSYSTAGDGGHGWWRWSTADLSAEVAADTRKGLYCAPSGGDGSTGAWVRQFVGKIKMSWFGVNPNSSALVNRQGAQAAVNMASFLGGGEVFIPAGSYNWNVALPVIVPSNITISGLRGQSIIVPDISTVVDETTLPWPKANNGVFTTGDPSTGNLAGERASDIVDPSKIVTDVHFKDFAIKPTYAGPVLAANYTLSGIYLIAARRCSVTGVVCQNIPGTGIRAVNIYDCLIDDNICIGNGLWQPAGTRNGISAMGMLDAGAEAQNSRAIIVTNNVCNDNGDVGIACAMNKGCVISDNVCIGNIGIGIEGDAAFATTETSVSLGYEVPTDVIITNNFVDMRSAANTWGITWAAGNQGRINISNNIIRNTLNKSAIVVTQTNAGVVEVANNLLDNCVPDTNFHQILLTVGRVTVTNNRIVNPGALGAGILILSPTICTSVVIKGNTIEDGVTNSIAVRPGNGAAVEFVDISDNMLGGSSLSAILIAAASAVNIKHLAVKNNTAVEVNTGAFSAEGFLRINATLTITKLICTGNDVSYGGTTTYPIFVNSGAGTIAYGRISDNDFGEATIPFAVGCTNDTAAFTKLYQNNNGINGQLITRAATPPTAAFRGDICLYPQPSGSSFIGEVCTVTGNPATWVTFGATS